MFAGPRKAVRRSPALPRRTIPPPGSNEPRTMLIVGRRETGCSSVRRTSPRLGTTLAMFSPTVFPVTVSALRSISGSKRLRTAAAPPASSSSSMRCSPVGRIAARSGIRSAYSSKIACMSRSRPASIAIAWRCLTRFEIFPYHLDDSSSGGPGEPEHPRAACRDRSAPRKRHPQCLTDDVHGVRRPHPGADARTADGVVCHPAQFIKGDLPGGEIARFQEDLLDVDVLAVPLAALLITADHDDGRNVQPTRGHQLTGSRLVARCETNHPVEQGAFDLHFDVVRDEVA